MGFAEDLREFSLRLQGMKEKIGTEEATKMSMIVPFFQLLGYDVFNPLEFCPEYTADVGIKKGEKVDYAIIQNNEPVILIECKWCGEDLDKHSSQLFRYFSTTSAKFGVLTNGLNYKFYTDLDETNKMDLTPFLEVDMSNIRDTYISELRKFCKDAFDKESIFSTASELKYSNLIKNLLQNELNEPSDNFVRFLLTSVYDAPKTQKIIDKFKPIVKKLFTSFINELMNQKISTALKSEDKINSEESSEQLDGNNRENKIITTEEELESFYIIRGLLAGNVDIKRVAYRDTESYFGILYDNNNRKPICRLNLDSKKKQILIPDFNKKFDRIYIESLTDIYLYKEQLIAVAKRYEDNNNPE